MPEKPLADVAVLILTLNEELNIAQALHSVNKWAREVFVLDSFSTDQTVELARKFGAKVYQHQFKNYSDQRNWALTELPIIAKWVLFLDADEWLPTELKDEIQAVLSSEPSENGFDIKRRFYWNGVWLRRGYYPVWLLRLFRLGKGKCEGRVINEHIVIEGTVGRLKNDFIHEDRKPFSCWVQKHVEYALMEAKELLQPRAQVGCIQPNFRDGGAGRNRWLRYNVYNHLPPLIRPLLYFFYRYILAGGFLDGCEAARYHFMQALWYPVLIDIHYLEMKRRHQQLDGFMTGTEAGTGRGSVVNAEVDVSVRSYFDSLAAGWSDRYGEKGAFKKRPVRLARMIARVDAPPRRVLDFGCGTGEVSRFLARLNYSVVGVDASSSMVAAARELDAGCGIRYEFLEDLESCHLAYDNSAFDIVLASSVLEYLSLDAKCLSELRRVCKQGGVLIATVPNNYHPLRWLEALEKNVLSRLRVYRRVVPEDRLEYLELSITRRSPTAWQAQLGACGWQVQRVSTWSSTLLTIVAIAK